MGEFVSLQSTFNLHFGTSYANGYWIQSHNSFPRKITITSSVPRRRVLNYRAISLSSPQNTNSMVRESSTRCSCSGIMLDLENAAASDRVPIIDQVLLTASVLLTYMAGVIPSGKSYTSAQKNNSSEIPVYSGSIKEEMDQTSCERVWNVVRGKITDALFAHENGVITGTDFNGLGSDHLKRPLSLSAVTHGSRVRLLLSTVEQLQKEVNEIPDTSETMENAEWLGLFLTTLTKTCRAVLISWMDKEFCAENCSPDKELLLYMSEKLKGDETILGNIRKSGKVELYADMIGFFRYGSSRDCSYYDQNVYSLHGGAILEDLIINIADAIASTYLEVISVDSDVSTKISNSSMSMCALSTRSLQKLRNEVAMSEWMRSNFGEIVLMYEDRFDLSVLDSQPCDESAEKRSESPNWWSKLSLGNSVKVESSMRAVVVTPFSLSVKRTRELKALRGWRYYFSLVLELADIALPMAKAVVAQVRNAISFLLVSLIGRSVGLVYTGIRQSLGWK